jgi:AcrR family transcriptional regulator
MERSSSDTRLAIVEAFNRLVLATRRARPPIAQLLRQAGVARSTLYSHFDDRDSLLLEAMGGPLSIMAGAALGEAPEERLAALLEHFWERRRGATDVLEGQFAKRLTRSLADFICAKDSALDRSDALRIADSLLGFVRLWISGQTPCPALDLARKMIASATAQRWALR